MKIAAVTDDSITISAHFGRATHYAVYSIENGRIIATEVRSKVGHIDFQQEEAQHQHSHQDDPRGHGYGRHSQEKHQRMFSAITDCQILLARGMGRGAYSGLQNMGVRPILTDIKKISTAVQAVIDGTIEDHVDRLH